MKDKILVETSARHVHVSEEHLKILFGEGAQLTPKKELSQPGQFAAEEKVTIVGPRNRQPNVTILGPCRNKTQVEISATDARALGIPAVIRESGDIKGTPGCTIIGPQGEVTISEGVIVAKRHIHLNVKEAEEYGLKDKEVVMVEVNTPERSLVFGDVVVRVRDDFAAAMHIDTDEANAGNIGPETYGTIIKKH
ncbi:MAG TPA: phosphate propanoyltransferase [Acholeplasmataceae bacterium]|nr:phosphate propanoyltransferase [Acholeplasmataceae bacterium]